MAATTVIANTLIKESDCLLVVGCKLGEIATKRYTIPAPRGAVIHLDIVAEEMGRTYQPELKLWGDARAGLQDLYALLSDGAADGRQARADYISQIPVRMEAWRAEVSGRLHSDESPIHMARLITEINRLLPEDGFSGRRWWFLRRIGAV